MNQTRLDSLYEALVNILIGYAINFAANLIVLPIFFPEIRISLWTNFIMGIPYTLISVVRQYAIRRIFNRGGIVKTVRWWLAGCPDNVIELKVARHG